MRSMLAGARSIGFFVVAIAAVTSFAVMAGAGQRGGAFRASRDHPAIQYTSGPVDNVVSRLNERLEADRVQLAFEGRAGYLRSLLDALEISIDSQVTVFSKTSRQASEISSQNPRSIYFNDTVAVGWVRDGDELEVATLDRHQGTVFYTLPQTPTAAPRLTRNDQCLACHLSWDTLGAPGLQVLSVAPLSADPNAYATGFVSDHRSPLEQRWGGWYVTGDAGPVAHMGNVEVTDVEDPEATLGQVAPALDTLAGVFDLAGFPSAHSDVVALMVLEHQVHASNLITRVGWEARRIAFRETATAASEEGSEELLRRAAAELVDYFLFVDEAPLAYPVTGSTGFAEGFSARGPRDRRGRSLRDLDLERRLFLYPCSYMIYTDAFGALPEAAKDAIYARLWEVLSAIDPGDPYRRMSDAERQNVVEILVDTVPDLPPFFRVNG